MDDNERPAVEPPKADERVSPATSRSRKPRTTEKGEPLLLPVSHHAAATGNAKTVPMMVNFSGAVRPGQTRLLFSWQHRCAAQLHGWDQHAHDAQEEFRCTREDYLEALAAVSAETARRTASRRSINVPHRAAISPFARRQQSEVKK